MEPGGEPQRLDGLPRLLFLQRSCSEGREWASEQDAGGAWPPSIPLSEGESPARGSVPFPFARGSNQHLRTQNLMRLSVPSTALPRLIQGLGTPPQPRSAFDRQKNPAAQRAEPLGQRPPPQAQADAGSGQEWCPHLHPQTGTYSAEVWGVRARGAHRHRVSGSRWHVQDGAWLGGAGHS